MVARIKNLLTLAVAVVLIITPSALADNSQADHPIRVEMTANANQLKDVATTEKFLHRMLVAFDTSLHLQDIRMKRTKLEGSDYAMEVYVHSTHLATYRVFERAESLRAVLLIYSR